MVNFTRFEMLHTRPYSGITVPALDFSLRKRLHSSINALGYAYIRMHPQA